MPIGPSAVAAWRANQRSNAVDLDRLHYMANQIARNFAAQGEDVAIAATAQHLRDFWDPRMKAAILAGDRAALNPIARAALDQLTP
jgi:formate dehydrogenase subunit delta